MFAFEVVLGIWLYAVLWYQCVVAPHVAVAVVVGLVMGAAVGGQDGLKRAARTRRAILGSALAWIGGSLLAPPQWVRFEAFYNETNYIELLNAERPFDVGWTLAGLFIAVAVAALCARSTWSLQRRRWLAGGLLALLCLNLVPRVITFSPAIAGALDVEPADKSYHFDGQQTLKIVYLMRQGEPYHRAYLDASLKDARDFSHGLSFQSIRPPMLFWLWAALPTPGAILWLGFVLTIASMVMAWIACAHGRDPLTALLAPASLGAFWAYGEMSYWIMYPDLWVAFPLVLSVAAWVRGWRVASALAGLAAFCVREFVGALMLSGLLASALERRWKDCALWAACALVGAGVYMWNDQQARTVIGMSLSASVGNRMDGSLAFSLSTLRFGSILIAGRDIIMPLLGLCCLAAPRYLPPGDACMVALPVLIHLLAFLKIGNPAFAQYYAFAYVPLALLGAAVVFSAAWTRQSGRAL